METLLFVLGAVVGTAITRYSARRTPELARAAEDLRVECARLRHLATMQINLLEDAGVIDGVKRNEKGEPIRYWMTVRRNPPHPAARTSSAVLRVDSPPNPN